MELYLGVDFHPHQQTVCWCDPLTGELKLKTLRHDTDEVRIFYQQMPPAIVGIEATAQATWFEQLLFENKHKLLVGNPKLIRLRATSRHKSDNRDAELIFDLLRRGEFPTLWRRPPECTQLLEILRLRTQFVRQRTQTYNRLQALPARGWASKRADENTGLPATPVSDRTQRSDAVAPSAPLRIARATGSTNHRVGDLVAKTGRP